MVAVFAALVPGLSARRLAQGGPHAAVPRSRVDGGQPAVTSGWYPAAPAGDFFVEPGSPLQERLGGVPSGLGAQGPEGPARFVSPGVTRRSLEALARINDRTRRVLAGKQHASGPDNPGA